MAGAKSKQSEHTESTTVALLEWLPDNIIPDLQWICGPLAHEPSNTTFPSARTALAQRISKNLDGFKKAFQREQIETHLLELAIINNRSLRNAIDQLAPAEGSVDFTEATVTGTYDQVRRQPWFVSLVTAYAHDEQRALDVLQCWDHAINAVVRDEECSIVGQTDTYNALYVQIPSPVKLNELAGAGGNKLAAYSKWYPFGQTTTIQPTLGVAPSTAVEPVARKLLEYFHQATNEKLTPMGATQDEKCWLIVIPFRRPFPLTFQETDPWALPGEARRASEDENTKWTERCGGCLFAVVSCTDAITPSHRPMDDRIRESVMKCHWILGRAAMFEARTEQMLSRSSEVGGFAHTTHIYLASLCAPVMELKQLWQLPALDRTRVESKVEELVVGVERMQSIADAYRRAWQIVNVDSSVESRFECRRLNSLRNLVQKYAKEVFDVAAKSRTQSPNGTSVKLVWEDSVTAPDREIKSMKADVIKVILAETISNAVSHSEKCGLSHRSIRVRFGVRELPLSDKVAICIDIFNPISAGNIETIRKRIEIGTLSLGLQTVATLGHAHGVLYRANVVDESADPDVAPSAPSFVLTIQVSRPLGGSV